MVQYEFDAIVAHRREAMGDFRKLRAWQEGHELAREVYLVFSVRASRGYPGLRAQVLRAAAAIPATVSEGCVNHPNLFGMTAIRPPMSSGDAGSDV